MKNKANTIIFHVFIFMFIVCSILAVAFYDKEQYKIVTEDYNNNWIVDGKETALNRIDRDTIAEKIITEDDINKSVIIREKSVFVDVYIDNNLVFKTERPTNNMLGKTPGLSYSFFEIKSEDVGKKIKLNITSPYIDGGLIYEIKIGEEVEAYRSLFKSNFFSACISFSVVLISVIVLLFYIPLRKNTKLTAEILYLGFFTMNIGIFLFLDSNLLQLVFGNYYYLHTVTELWMLLIMIPFLLFIKNTYKHKSNVGLLITSSMCVFIFLFTTFFDSLGFLDFHETIISVHFSYIVCAIYVLYIAIKNRMKTSWGHLLSASLVIIFTATDVILMWFYKLSESSLFTKFGIVLFMIIECVILLNRYLEDYKEKMKVEILKDLAYHDGLTGMLNRTSFIEKMFELENAKHKVMIVMFDVNDLKITNDTLGHDYGDKLIKGASSSIIDSFGEHGDVFRIGGDEFVAIVNYKINYEKTIAKMNNETLKYNDDKLTIKIAAGYSIYDKNKHKTMKAVYKEADKNMYKNKVLMKGKENIR